MIQTMVHDSFIRRLAHISQRLPALSLHPGPGDPRVAPAAGRAQAKASSTSVDNPGPDILDPAPAALAGMEQRLGYGQTGNRHRLGPAFVCSGA